MTNGRAGGRKLSTSNNNEARDDDSTAAGSNGGGAGGEGESGDQQAAQEEERKFQPNNHIEAELVDILGKFMKLVLPYEVYRFLIWKGKSFVNKVLLLKIN